MIKIYDRNKKFVQSINFYKDAKIEKEINITDTLEFYIPKKYRDLIQEEGYIKTKEGNFVIKEKNLKGNEYQIIAKYDVEELLEWVESESYVTMNIIDMFNDLLEGTGWSAKYGDEWERNLILESDTYISNGNKNFNWSVDTDLIQGQEITSSCYAEVENAQDTHYKFFRIGMETRITYEDDTIQYIQNWRNAKPGESFKKIITSTVRVQNKNIKHVNTGIYIQLGGDLTKVGRPKVEIGNKPTAWTPAPEDLTLPKRTVTGTELTKLELIYKMADTFNYEIIFDNLSKTIYVGDELGANKGTYFHDELNLKELETSSDTHDFATRLIPIGFDGMGIESINDGKNYVENHDYSNKIVTKLWEDGRYTNIENLKADAEKKLAGLAKEFKSFKASVIDLSRIDKYQFLDYELGDKVTLIERETKFKEIQRVVKKVIYLKNPEKDEVILENKPRSLGDEQNKIIDNLRSEFNITKASLELFEDSIVGRVTNMEGSIEDLNQNLEDTEENLQSQITENTSEIIVNAEEISNRVSQTLYDRNHKEISNNFAETNIRFNEIENKIQVGGGNNIIKNSVGYGELNYWEVKDEPNFEIGTSTWILQGVSKHGFKIINLEMEQSLDLQTNTEYTLSGKLFKKTEQGSFKIGLYSDNELVHDILDKNQETFDGTFSTQFNTENKSNYTLKISGIGLSETQASELTDLLLVQGVNNEVWSQANGEIYTLNVKLDGEGIRVYSTDGNGYTVMSPDEFSGYYDNEKIFTLNGDLTEVMGIVVKELGIHVPPVKLVQNGDESLDFVWVGGK